MMAEMISVPIYPTANQNTIKSIIRHCGMEAIFVGKVDDAQVIEGSLNKDLLTISFPYPTIETNESWKSWLQKYQPLINFKLPELEETASIIYTSGTTGEPKGVVLSYKNWSAAIKSTAELVQTQLGERCISYLPLAHITERSVIEGVALFKGLEVYFIETIDTFIDNLKYAKPHLFLSVPRLWTKFKSNVLLKIPQKKLTLLLRTPIIGKFIAFKIRSNLGLNHARIFGSGTAPISKEVLSWYKNIDINISEGWGMTETGGLSCANIPFTSLGLGTIGKPLSCVEMKLGPMNEILIKGDAVFSQYYLAPEETKRCFSGKWFHTGDCGEKTKNGAFKIVGRIKEQFKTSKGKYVAPAPIEKLLSANHHIEQVMVMGSGMKQPIALVNLSDYNDSKKADLETSLYKTLKSTNHTLESHQKLDYILICNEIWSIENELLTPTMKIKRNTLERRYQAILPITTTNKIIWLS
jgi:long-chain acyl-CoA synthetase